MGTRIQPLRELAWVLNQIDAKVAVIIPLGDLCDDDDCRKNEYRKELIVGICTVHKRYKGKGNDPQ